MQSKVIIDGMVAILSNIAMDVPVANHALFNLQVYILGR